MKKYTIVLMIMLMFFVMSCASAGPKKISMISVQNDEKVLRKQAGDIVREKNLLSSDGKYVVEKGDNLWKIAKLAYGSGAKWRRIERANNLKEPYIIKPGMRLMLSGSEIKINNNKKFQYRTKSNKAFGVGEKLTFAIKYFNITAGFGILEVKDIVEINGRQAYHIVAIAKTAPFFETFYRLRDTIESYMDVMGLFSWKYSKKLEEGDYRANAAIDFDHVNGVATKHDKKTFKVPRYVQDVLSELYYFRTMEFDEKGEAYIDVCSDEGKSYEILVKRIKKERVTTDAGVFDCVLVQPHLKYEGIFRQKGDVFIWLTDDENKIPVLVKSKIIIGTIDAVLQKAVVVEAK